MKHRILKILILALLPIMLSGCSNNYNNNQSMENRYDYNDNKLIASEGSYCNVVNSSIKPLINGKICGEIGALYGVDEILAANVDKNTESKLQIKLTANSGKGKLVLVKPDSEVEILAETVFGEEHNQFEGNISVKCIPGVNTIKVVGENYSGNFEIYQPNEVLFNNITDIKNNYKKSSKNGGNDMLGENFPFGN